MNLLQSYFIWIKHEYLILVWSLWYMHIRIICHYYIIGKSVLEKNNDRSIICRLGYIQWNSWIYYLAEASLPTDRGTRVLYNSLEFVCLTLMCWILPEISIPFNIYYSTNFQAVSLSIYFTKLTIRTLKNSIYIYLKLSRNF